MGSIGASRSGGMGFTMGGGGIQPTGGGNVTPTVTPVNSNNPNVQNQTPNTSNTPVTS